MLIISIDFNVASIYLMCKFIATTINILHCILVLLIVEIHFCKIYIIILPTLTANCTNCTKQLIVHNIILISKKKYT